jgi:DNA-directed RNA polymerase subunit RPC12/RpoP
MKCGRCKTDFNYTPSEYGGYIVPANENLCMKCWEEFIAIINQHNKELTKFWSGNKEK